MIEVLTDLIQSAALVIWAIWTILLLRRVNRLDKRVGRLDEWERVIEPEGPEPICGCSHHQCFHDENGCGNATNAYNSHGGGWGILTCGCKRYTGPEHLPKVIP